MFCLQTPRQVEYSDWLVGSVVVLDLVGCVKLGLSCRFDDASSGELAVSSEAVNAERKFLAGHIGWILTEKLCKTDAEVMDVLVGLVLNFWPVLCRKVVQKWCRSGGCSCWSCVEFWPVCRQKLCKNGVEVAENFWGVQAVLHNKFWALRAQILPITGLWEYSTKCRSNRDRQRIWH